MKILLFLAVILLNGCTMAVKQPVVQPFVDAEYWVLKAPMQYEIGDTGEYITVPKGFVTDFASTPPALRPLFPKLGRYIKAAIVHDYLYWNQTCSRKQADKIFEVAMANADVDPIRRNLMWAAVASFGGKAWDANAKKKLDGQVKVIPGDYLSIPEDITWEEYTYTLVLRRVQDGDTAVSLSDTCAAVEDVHL